MRQVFLSGVGRIQVFEVPMPGRIHNGLLIRNSHSLISAGTEGAAITQHSGVHGIYEKIVSSRSRFGQVWSVAQTQGMSTARDLVRTRLAEYSPVGYSSAGVVVEVDCPEIGFSTGDRVACMGAGYANHAQYVTVPRNLVARLPDGVSYEEASFGALACIAMQGIRRLELSPGERVCIVGLGLIGQLALRLARAMGYEAYGLEVDEAKCGHARQNLASAMIANPQVEAVRDWTLKHTRGFGFDGVVVCATSKSDSVVNAAFDSCRQRGRVSIIGSVGLRLERVKMYAKELELRLSCSYGVGRHDPEYELEGRDYNIAQTRWTAGRNLEYFLELLSQRKLGVGDLMSECVPIADSGRAYAMIKAPETLSFGVLLDHGLKPASATPESPVLTRFEQVDSGRQTLKRVRVGLLGAGAYAKNVHVPNLQKIPDMTIRAVASRSGGSAALVAQRVGAAMATSSVDELCRAIDVDALVISTRHASHGRLALRALEAGKHVYIEKPMATTLEDCISIVRTETGSARIVRVGFNRRFSPWLINMKASIPTGRRSLVMRVNVGNIADHWSNSVGEGGRLLGEGVHFFDLANWILDARPVTLIAVCNGRVSQLNPDVSVTITYADGSIATFVYSTIGHPSLGKEYFELHGAGRSVVVDDFKDIKGFGCRPRLPRGARGDKGQLAAMREFGRAVLGTSNRAGASAVDGLLATAMALATYESARRGVQVDLERFIDAAESPDASDRAQCPASD